MGVYYNEKVHDRRAEARCANVLQSYQINASFCRSREHSHVVACCCRACRRNTKTPGRQKFAYGSRQDSISFLIFPLYFNFVVYCTSTFFHAHQMHLDILTGRWTIPPNVLWYSTQQHHSQTTYWTCNCLFEKLLPETEHRVSHLGSNDVTMTYRCQPATHAACNKRSKADTLHCLQIFWAACLAGATWKREYGTAAVARSK